MNPFLKKILEATRLTRSGKLAEATAAIQSALSENAPAAPAEMPAKMPAAMPLSMPLAEAPSSMPPPAPAADEIVTLEERVGGAKPAPAAPRFEASSFTNAGGTRAFKLFEPAGFEGRALPLVVMLHGCTQNPDDFAAGTRMNELAQARGFYVLYPEQGARSNAHRCWNWFVPGDQQRGQGEPAVIAGMTKHVIEAHGIDRDRVYVAGLSAGGAMAAILAREYADVYAAAGVHSGLPAGAAHDVASAFGVMRSGAGGASGAWPGRAPAAKPAAARRSAPVIVFHGSADTTVAPANGDAVIASVLAASPGATRVDRASPAGALRGSQQSVWSAAAAPAGAPSLAEQWRVAGAPHAWSGGAPAGSFTDADGPDASAEMLRFFLAHPRRHGG